MTKKAEESCCRCSDILAGLGVVAVLALAFATGRWTADTKQPWKQSVTLGVPFGNQSIKVAVAGNEGREYLDITCHGDKGEFVAYTVVSRSELEGRRFRW